MVRLKTICFLLILSKLSASQDDASRALTEHPGGIITEGTTTIPLEDSPYWMQNDLIVEQNAKLVIEPGVRINFEPQIGITVRGVLIAEGNVTHRITLTSKQTSSKSKELPKIRLVDGPSILAGRVQIYHQGKWRSVCSNSRNWTQSDMETACRQLGFQGGSFFNWFNREFPYKSRLLYEEPKCRGTESTIFECQWSSKSLGAGACDYHPDLGIQCLPYHDNPSSFWRGIRFENAASYEELTINNRVYVPTSKSSLKHINILNAGAGRDRNATSAVEVWGIPPVMQEVDILDSAYNGINVTMPHSPVSLDKVRVRGNRGYGVFINSTYGFAHVTNSYIVENGADGIRYVHNEDRPDERGKIADFCTLATVSSQTFPVDIYASQSIFNSANKLCSKTFTTQSGHRLTVSFIKAITEVNDTAAIEVYDGYSNRNRLILSVPVRNNTRPQSATSTFNQIHVVFKANPGLDLAMYMRITSGLDKKYDLKVTHTDVSENLGRGVVVDNLRNQVHVHNSSISKNSHTAGIQITSGVGDVNVTNSKIFDNLGDGINITYTGGSRNISWTTISSNTGFGLAIWLNSTEKTEYIYVNQTSVVQYSTIIKNLDTGVLHGNFCQEASVNISGNVFQESKGHGLEIMSCWQQTNHSLQLQIGHNSFLANEKLGVKIYPALNMFGNIEYNYFKRGLFGGLLIRNKPLEEYNIHPTNLIVQYNHFRENKGVFVISLGLSPYSEKQILLFTKNFVKDNVIEQPYQPEDGSSSKLIPRSLVAAPVIISSSNVIIFRNIIDNPRSKYELGSHFQDQSKQINCTYNWLGNEDERVIFTRVFHRYNRYNLAKIIFTPYLLHNSNVNSNRININPSYIPYFNTRDSNIVGGEIEGEETLSQGEYVVENDINIRPGGKLTLEAGVTLMFPPSIGMMVGGKLEARGLRSHSIKFTLKEEITPVAEETTYEIDTEVYNSETEIVAVEPRVPIRLLGGETTREGRLQIKLDGEWGTVCNYGWTIRDAAIVCHQLGLALNPDDWYLERSEIPKAGTNENITLTNVQCDEFDIDITKCKSDRAADFDSSCTHDNDVGIRCYETSWAGIRFSSLSERSDMQYLTIEKAGLLDYATNSFKPALQLDFSRHNFESIKVTNNYHDGLSVMYSDLYRDDSVNIVRDSEFTYNRGAGINFKQLGLKIYSSVIENNAVGIRYNPALTGLQQRELAGWFNINDPDINYSPFRIPQETDSRVIYLEKGETKYLVTSRVIGNPTFRSYRIKCDPGLVIGLQLLNPIQNGSTESIWIHDSLSVNNESSLWIVQRDLTVFPTSSISHGVVMNYTSGDYSLGGTVIVVSTIRAPIQNVYNKIVKGPVPTVTLQETKIKNNIYGIHVSYYNRYLNELGDHFLRSANESIKIFNCEIARNKKEAIFVHSPHWDLHRSNISEITLMINDSLITDNGKGIFHFSRDMRASNNLFHYILQDVTVERNMGGGFDIRLPYVWQYNENFTHSVYMGNNTWRNNKDFSFSIDGHYAIVNVTNNTFTENMCKNGLISLKGMEKKLLIDYNTIENNNGRYMVEFKSSSQSEIIGQVPAKFIKNLIKRNKFASMLRGFGVLQSYLEPTSAISFKGIQKVLIRRNLFIDNNLEYLLIAGIKTAKIDHELDAMENWWGTTNSSLIQNYIFDFDDWNNHAITMFRPFLVEESFEGSHSGFVGEDRQIDLNNIGGRITKDLVLERRETPYIIRSDVTIMPKTTLTINPGVIMEFAPNVGILVLGSLKAKGFEGNEIVMRPLSKFQNLKENSGDSSTEREFHNTNYYNTNRYNQNNNNNANYYNNKNYNNNNYNNYNKNYNNNNYNNNNYNSNFTNNIYNNNQGELPQNRLKRQIERFTHEDSIRLCKGKSCFDKEEFPNEGFLEYFNKTTLQWIPMCDPRFTERNAQVVCRELGFDPINSYFDHDQRIEFHSNSLSRIWSWPEPLQCVGTETKYEDCPIRLNGQQFGHRHECKWDSKFVFIHCGERNLPKNQDYWGGIRFADSEFEHHMYNNRIHDVHTHNVLALEESEIEYVKIIGAGVLHNEKSAAVESIIKSPKIKYVSITNSASHGLYIISPSQTMTLYGNTIENSLGVGLNMLSLTGEGREGQESSFIPLKSLNLPYNLFSLVDICDTSKVIEIEERVLLYYKYDNHPVNCVKIFKSRFNVKPFGFRLLQFNLFNASVTHGMPDFITLYDGDIYNVSSKLISTITMKDSDGRKMYSTREPSMSVKLFANGASSDHGFIAEVVTLPISAIGFNREVQNNITNSIINNNKEGGLNYVSAGEVHPIITVDRNQFKNNGVKLYGNFTTCKAAVDVDIQNTQILHFRNNLVENNQGGLAIKADSRSSATSLKGFIHNNLFVNNHNHPALYVEGRHSSPYQEITIYRNYFTRNKAEYANNIVLKQVVSNFTFNYVKRNIGLQNVEISGFDKVRLPIYQSTTHNGFYKNYALFRDGKSTIVAGTAGQHYVDNIFWNPDNDYEMITVNRSFTLEVWKTKVDATYNYWGVNTTFAVQGRIKDQSDDPHLLEVDYNPFYMNNKTVLNGKCPPGWDLVGDTCYMYIGAPMTFYEAKKFCEDDNASMPYLIGNTNYYLLYDFLLKQQQWYLYSDRVWVQHIDMINECTTFVYQHVEQDDCNQKSSFVCEIDPKVYINPLVWHGDTITIAVIGSVAAALFLIVLVGVCWWSKSKYRHAQRLERRNSIRQSLHSLRSIGSTNGLSDYGYRRKVPQMSKSTDPLTKPATDYKKMFDNGSIDSMEKSAYTSSIEDNNSYTYENNTTATPFTTIEYHKPKPEHSYAQPYNLAFQNQGFKDTSTFASNSNYQSRAESTQGSTNSDEVRTINTPDTFGKSSPYPPSEYYTTDTLPLHTNSAKPTFINELKTKLPHNQYDVLDLPAPPDPPSLPTRHITPVPQKNPSPLSEPRQRGPVTNLMQENLDPPQVKPKPKPRAKSEALLETNFDYIEPEVPESHNLTQANRSKSQPLETAM